MSKNANSQTVVLSDISDFGDLVPIGAEFTACGAKIEAKSTKQKEVGTGGGKPFLCLTFRVLNGVYEGLEVSKSYFLTITKSQKNGRLYGRGVTELCADMTAIGKPLPKDYPFQMTPTLADVQALAKIVGERVKRSVTPIIHFKAVAERVQENKDGQGWKDAFNEDGTPKVRAKYVITGTGKPNAVTEIAHDEQESEDDGDPQDSTDLL